MRSDWYALLSMGMRYWFVIIAAIIVLRAWRATLRDTRRARVLRAWAPDTGAIGEIVVLVGSSGVRKGTRIPVPKEGLLGSARRSDVRLKTPSVRRYHAHIEQRENGVLVEALGKAQIFLNGRSGEKLLLRDGDRFTIGSIQMMLVLYSPGKSKEVNLDIAEDELFSPVGLNAAHIAHNEKVAPSRTKKRGSSRALPMNFVNRTSENDTKLKSASKAKGSNKFMNAKRERPKKVPSTDELFMPFDDGFDTFQTSKKRNDRTSKK